MVKPGNGGMKKKGQSNRGRTVFDQIIFSINKLIFIF